MIKVMVLFFGLLPTTWCVAQSLAPESVPAGFKPLFDGQSLVGWHIVPRLGYPRTAGEALSAAPAKVTPGKVLTPQEKARGRWTVRDGIIIGGQDEQRVVHREDGADWGLGSYLMTDETFGDFELVLDARPDWPCDTGIYVRCTPQGQGIQINLDHRGDDTAGVGGGIGFLFFNGTGSFRVNPYNFRWTVGTNGSPTDVKLIPGHDGVTNCEFAASPEEFRRTWHMNDWNTFRIRVVGEVPHITTWINDVRICECDTATLKFSGYNPNDVKKLLGVSGHIGLEVHDGPPWRWGIDKYSRWRNIYIKELVGLTK